MAENNSAGPEESKQWTRCPSGRFSSLSNNLRRRRQRRFFLKTAGALAVLAGAGGMSWLGVQALSGLMYPGGLSCDQVHQLAERYRNGSLAAELRQRMRYHVANCSRCAAGIRLDA